MSRISDALIAIKKATPGPWAVHPIHATVDAFDKGRPIPVCGMLWPTDERTEDQTEANADIIAAAPDMAAWIKKALPWLEERRIEAQSSLETIMYDVEGWEQNSGYRAVINTEKDVASHLDALLAEAKGTEEVDMRELLGSLAWAPWSACHYENAKRLLKSFFPGANWGDALENFTEIILSPPQEGSPK